MNVFRAGSWIALLSSLVTAVSAEPLARVQTTFYYIDGTSATMLAAQIDQKGPAGPDGKRFAAHTKWNIQWKFRHAQEGVTCSMKDAAVLIGIAQTMPRWRGEGQGAAALNARWQKFVEALKRHEEQHKQNGIKAGAEIEKALLAVKPHSNCEDLAGTANTAAEEIVKKYQKLDQEYDRKTEHGRTEGATLI